ncbi:hypothetical protein ACIQ6K_12040 [Streptomyces sp. NPDC096354]|uniref:hypothetical protein n=1 Tax=Streptomyces sp. NPDC096354 TaxID=3366088 RepID=UPI0038287AB2
MQYSDQWQELFDLAERPRAVAVDGATAHMSLASAVPEHSGGSSGRAGEGGGEGLEHSGGPWTSASGAAGTLRTNTALSHNRLGPAHDGVASGLKGLSSLMALTAVRESWEGRLARVRDECHSLERALSKVAKEMGETETAVKSSFNAVKDGERR